MAFEMPFPVSVPDRSRPVVSAVSAGLKTGMMKKMEERSKGFMGISLTAKSLKPLELNPDCAFSVLSQERTLDFVAANPEERDRWLKNLRLVLVHARTYDGFGGGGCGHEAVHALIHQLGRRVAFVRDEHHGRAVGGRLDDD